jgi:hypothetical protein
MANLAKVVKRAIGLKRGRQTQTQRTEDALNVPDDAAPEALPRRRRRPNTPLGGDELVGV